MRFYTSWWYYHLWFSSRIIIECLNSNNLSLIRLSTVGGLNPSTSFPQHDIRHSLNKTSWTSHGAFSANTDVCFVFSICAETQHDGKKQNNLILFMCTCLYYSELRWGFFWLSCVYFLAMLVWGKSKGNLMQRKKERKDRNVTASLWKCNLEKKTQRREGMGKRWKLYFSHESLLFRNLTLKGVLKWNRLLFLLSPSHLSSYSKKSGLW